MRLLHTFENMILLHSFLPHMYIPSWTSVIPPLTSSRGVAMCDTEKRLGAGEGLEKTLGSYLKRSWDKRDRRT